MFSPYIICAIFTLLRTALADTYSNPLKKTSGSDPFMVYVDGYYYLTTTTGGDLAVTRATTLDGLKTGEYKSVFKDSVPERACNYWAPEIHLINGTWYMYYTAGNCQNLDGQRSHVLQGGASPWDSYSYLGQVTPDWGIDGTVLVVNNVNYFVRSCQANGLQSLCISTLNTPCTIGPPTVLSQPTADWEKAGFPVNEGPAPMYHGDSVFMAFSASSCWTAQYQLGLLTLVDKSNPLNPNSWTKSGPVFSAANNNFGTGHNGFFTSPDGSQVWNVYHADANPQGACDDTRYTMADIVNFRADGSPDFGAAEALGTQLQGPSGELGEQTTCAA